MNCCKNRTFYSSFFVPKIRKEVAEMAKRNRTNPVQFYLSDDEQYILNTKFKASGMKSMSAFLRKLILYGYVYDVDYSYLRNYNTELGRISSNLNQIAKRVNSTGNIYQEDINEVKEFMNEVWQSDQNGSTWKTQLRRDINFFIKSASTYEEFLLLMWAKGYEIKGKTFGEDAAKYISFRPLDKEHFVRGSARSLGKEYTKERIRERIEKKRERKAVIPKKDYSARRLIDTSDEKFQNSPGLQQWAAIENLKIAAQSYNEAGSLSDLEHKITVKTEAGKSAKQSVVELEHRMKDLAEIIKYAEQYKDNRSYHIGYKKAKNPILLGVCIHENDIKPIINQIYKLKDSIYGKQDEIKSTKLIREATITKNRTNNKAYGEGMVDIITYYDAAILP